MGATLIKLAKNSSVESKQLHLKEIWIYPVKSLGGIRVNFANLLTKGLEFDRRYMLVTREGIAITQRDCAELALFKTAFDRDQIVVTHAGDQLEIPVRPSVFLRERSAQVWDDPVTVSELSKEASDWFSNRLDVECSLVFFPEKNPRPVDVDYQIDSEDVSLADAYPILMISEESLNDLNSRLNEPVPMNRFRPNFVIEAGDAFAEDEWKEFMIGGSGFAAVKPCARCIVTTINQNDSSRGAEPLKTMASYRTHKNKVLFGQNVIIRSGTSVQEGDQIEIRSIKYQTDNQPT
jgi:uncharacterized protein